MRSRWPRRKKTVCAPGARRRYLRAEEILHNAKMYLFAHTDGDLWDAVAQAGDRPTADALALLDDAFARVHATYEAAEQEARHAA